MGGQSWQAVSLLVLIWIFKVSILELLSVSQVPAVRQSVSGKIVVKAILLYKQQLELLMPAMCLQENYQKKKRKENYQYVSFFNVY